MNRDSAQIKAALERAEQSAGVEGSHHRMWVIDQMVRCLTGDGYAGWVIRYNAYRDEDGEVYGPWDEGIAP